MQTPVHPIHLLLGAFSSAPRIMVQMKHEPKQLKYKFLIMGYLIYLFPAMITGQITVATITSSLIEYFFSLLMIVMPAIILNRDGSLMYKISSMVIDSGIAFYGYIISLVVLFVLLSSLSILMDQTFGLALTQEVYLPFAIAYVVSFFALYSMEFTGCHTNKIEQWHIDWTFAVVFIAVFSGSIYMLSLVGSGT
jgi:hypothetical protein